MHCGLSVKANMHKTHRLKQRTACEDRERICFAFVLCVWSANPEDPKLFELADDLITQGGIGGLGSLVYKCV